MWGERSLSEPLERGGGRRDVLHAGAPAVTGFFLCCFVSGCGDKAASGIRREEEKGFKFTESFQKRYGTLKKGLLFGLVLGSESLLGGHIDRLASEAARDSHLLTSV